MEDGATVLDLPGLRALVDALVDRGYQVFGPTVRQRAVVLAEITSVDDLPVGWGDEQEAGRYRLRQRGDRAVFGYSSGAQSAKPILYPPAVTLWRRAANSGPVAPAGSASPGSPGSLGSPGGPANPAEPAGTAGLAVPPDRPAQPVALFGVRSCDVQAIAVHDRILAERRFTDPDYTRRRAGLFVVAVTCAEPGGTCFCASMGTGPRPELGLDLALTELLDDDRHEFLLEPGSDRGAEVLAGLPGRAATDADADAADRVARAAVSRMGRTVETDGIKEVLYSGVGSWVWDEVATRCYACTNCVLVCPTCFCTSVRDQTDLSGAVTERHRVWDTCYSAAYSAIHGRSVRASIAARYRQWLSHKFASWLDQFGTSGCVGCGRCITWCPAAIDVTAELARLRSELARSGQVPRSGQVLRSGQVPRSGWPDRSEAP